MISSFTKLLFNCLLSESIKFLQTPRASPFYVCFEIILSFLPKSAKYFY